MMRVHIKIPIKNNNYTVFFYFQHKSLQQDQLTKELRNQKKTLTENAAVMSNQKTLFKVRQIITTI